VRVARIVRGATEHEEQIERLATEAAEGLEQQRYGDVLTRSVCEIVANICKGPRPLARLAWPGRRHFRSRGVRQGHRPGPRSAGRNGAD
jgi:hypothetical protein